MVYECYSPVGGTRHKFKDREQSAEIWIKRRAIPTASVAKAVDRVADFVCYIALDIFL